MMERGVRESINLLSLEIERQTHQQPMVCSRIDRPNLWRSSAYARDQRRKFESLCSPPVRSMKSTLGLTSSSSPSLSSFSSSVSPSSSFSSSTPLSFVPSLFTTPFRFVVLLLLLVVVIRALAKTFSSMDSGSNSPEAACN